MQIAIGFLFAFYLSYHLFFSKENCVHYVKSVAENEKEKIQNLMEEEQQKQEIHNQKLADITEQFVSLSENIDQLGDANETSANEATTLEQHIQEISNFCQELNSSLATMSDFINIYKASNEDISSIDASHRAV